MKRKITERDINILTAIDELHKSIEGIGAFRLIYSTKERPEMEIQMLEDVFVWNFPDYQVEKRADEKHPYELSAVSRGVRFCSIVTEEEFEKVKKVRGGDPVDWIQE